MPWFIACRDARNARVQLNRVALISLLLLSMTGALLGDDTDRPLTEALTIIEKSFLKETARKELVKHALRAFLKDLDPYSYYLDANEWKEFENTVAAEFVGVGVILELDAASGVPRVGNLLIGSAAGAAGMQAGDLITAIDGRPLKGMTLDDVIPLLRGTVGSTVVLTVLHGGSNDPVVLKIQRRTVKTPSVRGVSRNRTGQSEYLFDAERGIGYIRISRLAADTVSETENALAGLKARGMKALILDLRDSSGGLMQAAIGVADLFLDSGRILSTVSRDKTTVYDAKPGGYLDFPVIALINEGTGSSSEFLAAALQDNKRAIFIGQRTYGKARVQTKLPLSEGLGGLILTTGKFQRPSGKIVDRHDAEKTSDLPGISPDPGMELIVSEEEHKAWQKDASLRDSPAIATELEVPSRVPDRVLDRALQLIRDAKL
jgi:carboxyl-terminal processing protease